MGEPAISMTRAYERDEDLAAALAAGQPGAWQQLFDEHHQRIFQYAFIRTSNRSDADDIASSVFVEAVKNIGSFTYRGVPVSAWLFRIARNEIADLLKRRGRTSTQSLSDDRLAGSLRATDSMEGRDGLSDVTSAMSHLKSEYRDVILLRFLHGLSVAETSAVMDKSEGAIKVTQTRALQSLRRALDG